MKKKSVNRGKYLGNLEIRLEKNRTNKNHVNSNFQKYFKLTKKQKKKKSNSFPIFMIRFQNVAIFFICAKILDLIFLRQISSCNF